MRRPIPDKLNFGFGLGTLPQILGETFKAVTKTDIVSIPYKGGAQAITDMLGGRIQMNFGTPPTLLPLIQQGKIRALAVTTDARYRDMPDVPTMIESGLPQLALTFSAGVLAPAGTPAPILDTLNAAFREALKSPELTASMAKLGFAPEPWTRAAIRRVPGRGDAEVAADREGVRREGGVTMTASGVSARQIVHVFAAWSSAQRPQRGRSSCMISSWSCISAAAPIAASACDRSSRAGGGSRARP